MPTPLRKARPARAERKTGSPVAVKRQPKTTAKKSPRKANTKPRGWQIDTVNVHGYRTGSDTARIVDELCKGGKDRLDIVHRLENKLDSETRNGTRKSVSTLVSATVRDLLAKGYKIESHWVLIPPARIRRKLDTPTKPRGVSSKR